jgi:hypothetical protein
MRRVRDEVALRCEIRSQGPCHAIERAGERAKLARPLLRDVRRQIAAAHARGGLGKALDPS